MRILRRTMIAALALSAAPLAVNAQTVFFDDFDGNALLPHWNQPAPSSWAYNVSNSMLNVTGLFSPSNPKSGGNFASMHAPFTPQADFQVDAWMGWEPGQYPHVIELRVLGPFGANPIIARMRYENGGIYAGAGGGPPVSAPAPLPGIHHFTINRTAGQFNFYLNGSVFATFPDDFATPAANVGLRFVGPYPGELGPLHIDRVVVVPAPGAAILVAAGLSFNRRRALRRN